jgi:hypothetical protein
MEKSIQKFFLGLRAIIVDGALGLPSVSLHPFLTTTP